MKTVVFGVGVALQLFGIAQAGVLVVGGPNAAYTDIQTAVNAAVDGDLLLIRAGNYQPVTINGKALSLCADGPVYVAIQGGLSITNTAALQVVVLSGLRVFGDQRTALELLGDLGPVRVQDCVFTGANGAFAPQWFPSGWPGARIDGCMGVSFAGCTFRGGYGEWCTNQIANVGDAGDGVFARGSRIAFTTCSLTGGEGGSCWEIGDWSGGRGGSGLYAEGGVFYAAGSTLRGGAGGRGSDPYGFHFGGCGGGGGNGATLLNANTAAYWLNNQYFVGAGGQNNGMSCSGGQQAPSGLPVYNYGALSVSLSGAARSFHVQQPIREQTIATLLFTGQPGDQVWAIEGDQTRAFWLVPAAHGVSLVRDPVLMQAGPLGVIPASGTLQIPRPQGDLAPGVQHRLRFSQALFVDPAGQSFLADVQAMELLDSAY